MFFNLNTFLKMKKGSRKYPKIRPGFWTNGDQRGFKKAKIRVFKYTYTYF